MLELWPKIRLNAHHSLWEIQGDRLSIELLPSIQEAVHICHEESQHHEMPFPPAFRVAGVAFGKLLVPLHEVLLGGAPLGGRIVLEIHESLAPRDREALLQRFEQHISTIVRQ